MNENSMYKFVEAGHALDPRKMVIEKGDTVLYENEKYIVEEAGMRWLRARRISDGMLYSMKKSSAVKLLPEYETPKDV